MDDVMLTQANAIAGFLQEHKCSDVKVVDLRPDCSWTDFFVIGTVTSSAHMRGVAHQLWGELNTLGLSVANRHKKLEGEGWELIDCGDIIIHLMDSEMREFYSLEKLWQKLDG
ncbi:MAG: ribosome silencing factor [Sphaerochaeta sp.]|jgi:ribosome-associated protein|nr:ribosome silencing factor [Spirochaetales bacterium]